MRGGRWLCHVPVDADVMISEARAEWLVLDRRHMAANAISGGLDGADRPADGVLALGIGRP